MTEAQATTTSFEGQRISITTSRSFDDVLARLRQLIGTDSWSSTPAAMQELGGANQANFETIVRSRLGPSEFMLFHEINHSQWAAHLRHHKARLTSHLRQPDHRLHHDARRPEVSPTTRRS
jgi:hypothetical protein